MVGRARRRLAIEAALVALALVGVAFLIRRFPFTPAARRAEWAAEAGAVRVAGTLWPARRGFNQLELTVSTAAGPVAAAAVEALFLPVGGGAVVAQRQLTVDGAGRYAAANFALTRAGPWQLLVTVHAPGQPAQYGRVDWVVGEDGGVWLAAEPRPWPAELLGWLNRQGAQTLGILAVAATLAWGWRAWRLWRPAHTATFDA